jgi:hypothetical protein
VGIFCVDGGAGTEAGYGWEGGMEKIHCHLATYDTSTHAADSAVWVLFGFVIILI